VGFYFSKHLCKARCRTVGHASRQVFVMRKRGYPSVVEERNQLMVDVDTFLTTLFVMADGFSRSQLPPEASLSRVGPLPKRARFLLARGSLAQASFRTGYPPESHPLTGLSLRSFDVRGDQPGVDLCPPGPEVNPVAPEVLRVVGARCLPVNEYCVRVALHPGGQHGVV
jgi:hypothetical protein